MKEGIGAQAKEEQFREVFKKLFHGETEEAAARLVEWAKDIREEAGNLVVELSHRTAGLTTVFTLLPKEGRLFIAVTEETRGPELRVVGGNFLSLKDLRYVSVMKRNEDERGECVMFQTPGRDSRLEIYQSGVFEFFNCLGDR